MPIELTAETYGLKSVRVNEVVEETTKSKKTGKVR
jgi:hypothetical protein